MKFTPRPLRLFWLWRAAGRFLIAAALLIALLPAPKVIGSVAFGDKIAFENSLPEALASLFQGGTTGTPPQTPQQPTQPEPGGTGNATLTRALAEAQAALSASQEALRAGDFAKYGEEQAKLAAAIERAVAAQRAAVAPSPSPSPSATPSPSPTQTGTALGRR